MAASYNRPPRAGQPIAEDAARRLADRLLLATCAAAEGEAALRAERALRDAALRFVVAGRARAAATAQVCLDELRDKCEADAAFVVRIEAAEFSVLLSSGTRAGSDLFGAERDSGAALLEATRRYGTASEYPGAGEGGAQARAQEEIARTTAERAGLRALRWAVHAQEGGSPLLTALHVGSQPRTWTPARRRLHDGMAEVLALALGAATPRARTGR